MAYTSKVGSEWSKWDLHVHTPLSLINDYGGDSDAIWEKFIDDLEKLPPEFQVLGINDYLFIDGYEKVLQYKERGRLSNIRLILPVIEFRIDKFAGHREFKRINFHVIFSDQLSPEIIQAQFLNALTPYYKLDDLRREWSGLVTRQSLTDFGNEIIASTPEHLRNTLASPIKVGFSNLNLNIDKILLFLRSSSYFKNKYLTAIGKAEWNNFNWGEDSIAEKKKLINDSAQIIFTASNSVSDFNEGKKKLEERGINNLLLDCSDAHHFSTSSQPIRIGNCFTWIKGDRTFDGLRQILFEKDRIFVGDKPQIFDRVRNNKTKYIKSIEIKKNSTSSLTETWFDNISIELNPELVAIVGNKGSGKSALADIIALTGNSKKGDSFSFLNDDKFKKYPELKAQYFEATLTWQSSVSSTKNLNDDVNPSSVEQVCYIPQNHLEVLCNSHNIANFRNELGDVIFSHVKEPDRLNQKTLDEYVAHKKQSIDQNITALKVKINNLNEKIIELEGYSAPEYLEQITNALQNAQSTLAVHELAKPEEVLPPVKDPAVQSEQEIISNEIATLKEELLKIQTEISEKTTALKKANITYDELTNFTSAIARLVNHSNELKEEYSETLSKYGLNADNIIKVQTDLSPINTILVDVSSTINSLALELSSNEPNEHDEHTSLPFEEYRINSELEILQNKLDIPNQHYQQYLVDLEEWSKKRTEIIGDTETGGAIKYLEHWLSYIQKRTSTSETSDLESPPVNSLEGDINKLIKDREKIVREIFQQKLQITKIYRVLYKPVEDIISQHEILRTEYPVSVDVSLIAPNFKHSFLRFVNQAVRGSFHGKEEGYGVLSKLYDGLNFNEENTLVIFIDEILKHIRSDHRDGHGNEKRTLQKQLVADTKELYDFLFNLDFLEATFELKLNNKELSELSPGERGALLLVFYLVLDNREIPLIIDQPEENLDNQSIYRILVPFMKKAKARRQLIIVTHIPNIAVVCDSEQIININIDKSNGNEVKVKFGAIENPEINQILVDILEGTRPAFDYRDDRYKITQRIGL